jgi:hypothetical protein
MARYVQVKNQAGEWELIEVGDRQLPGPRVHIVGAKERQAYRSPLDGSVITSERQERYHMESNNVVRPGDFGSNEGKDYFQKQRQHRQDFLDGKSPEHHKEVKQAIIETVQKLEQGQKPAKPVKEDI